MRKYILILIIFSLCQNLSGQAMKNLSRANNTSDADKPVSTATQVALASMTSTPLYLFSGFTHNYSKVMLSYSIDGLTFLPYKETPVYSYETQCRDASIIFYDDAFYIAYTATNNTVSYLTDTTVILKSNDLFNWTKIKSFKFTGATRVWAPEWFEDTDGSLHLLVAADTAGNNVLEIYELHPNTTNLSGTWSTPKVIFNNGGNRCIDPYLVKEGNTYYLWYVGTDVDFQYATSTHIDSGYTIAKTGDWTGFGAQAEGECLIKLSNGNYRIYFDQYSSGHFNSWYSESTDTMQTWSAKAAVTSDDTLRHGTILPIRELNDKVKVLLSIVNQDNHTTSTNYLPYFYNNRFRSSPLYRDGTTIKMDTDSFQLSNGNLTVLNGKVGIGEVPTNYNFQVATGANGTPVFHHSSGYGGLILAGPSASSGAGLFLGNNFGTSYVEKMRAYYFGNTNILKFQTGGSPGQAATNDILGLTTSDVILYQPATLTSNITTADSAKIRIETSLLADSLGVITLATGVAGWGECMAGDNQEWAHFRFSADGTVTLITNTANVTTTVNTVDKLNIYDAGSGIAIQNNLGAAKKVSIDIRYFTP